MSLSLLLIKKKTDFLMQRIIYRNSVIFFWPLFSTSLKSIPFEGITFVLDVVRKGISA